MARDPDHDRIEKKAHELWEAAGKPHGLDAKHWDEAREIIAIQDSQRATLKPRRSGAKEPVEEPAEALRNQGEFPTLTDQGENLLTSTDREPDLIATPSGRKGRMPKAEVPTSDQPGVAPKARKASPKAAKAPEPVERAQPKTASVEPKAASAEPKAASAPPKVAKEAAPKAPKAAAKAKKPA